MAFMPPLIEPHNHCNRCQAQRLRAKASKVKVSFSPVAYLIYICWVKRYYVQANRINDCPYYVKHVWQSRWYQCKLLLFAQRMHSGHQGLNDAHSQSQCYVVVVLRRIDPICTPPFFPSFVYSCKNFTNSMKTSQDFSKLAQ